MKPWDIFRQSMGCLTLFIAFGAGVLVAGTFCWIDEHRLPFIDQPTAARYALESAQDSCERDLHLSPAACTFRRFRTNVEDKDGWNFTVWSADEKKGVDMLVDRRGTTEVQGEVHDVAPVPPGAADPPWGAIPSAVAPQPR